MVTIRETDKARLLEYDGIQFWIQKKWQRKDGTLTPAGKKSMAIAADQKRRYPLGFNAANVFTVVSETAKAVLLSCEIKLPNESRHVEARFWVPRQMITDYNFVSGKVREVEASFPFVGTKAIWPQGK